MEKRNRKSFLDLGCGIGRHTILFAQNGFNTYAFDLSEEAVNATKKWAEELNLNVDYKIGDMLNLPYEDTLLIAFFVEMLYHIQILKVLKNN